mmetsp:Transcript_18668/g.53230  ORF Transcript_18668/g.53230 Transcript_18668/m.53230 type:complete len:295 (+) Transcript_18668:250-1134(+)
MTSCSAPTALSNASPRAGGRHAVLEPLFPWPLPPRRARAPRLGPRARRVHARPPGRRGGGRRGREADARAGAGGAPGRARRALDRRGHVPRRGLPGGLRGRGQARGRRRRAPPGPGPGARGRARRRGPGRPRRLRGGPAGRRRRARRGARRRAQGRGHDRHLRRDHAVLGRDDNLNGAGRRRRGDGPPARVQRLPRRRRAQPHEAGDEEVRRGERRRRLALPHRHDALDGRGPRERLRPSGAAQDVQRAARRRPGDRWHDQPRPGRRRPLLPRPALGAPGAARRPPPRRRADDG